MNKYYFLLAVVWLCSPFMADAATDTVVSCHDTTVCLYQSDFQIVVCSPYGGHYFGPGVKDTVENTYVPFWAGVGKHLVTYRIGTFTCSFYVTIIDQVNAGSIVGDNKICSEGEEKAYQIPSDTTARMYYWKIPQWNNFADSTTVPINSIRYDNSFNGGTLQASVRNQCGEGNGSSIQIQVLPTPVPTIKNLSDTLSLVDNICKNQRLSYYAYGDFDSCRWTIQGGTLISNDTSRLMAVKWGKNTGEGQLGVAVYKNGCSGSSFRNVILGQETAPDPAVIWLFGYNMLVCSDSTAGSYCWFQDNNVYTGVVSASGRYILPDPQNKQSTFFVRTSGNPSCETCYNDSESFSFSKTGFDHLTRVFQIAPNPATNTIELKTGSGIDPEGRFLLYNQHGVLVKEKIIKPGNLRTDISNLPAGLYFVEFISEAGIKLTSRIIKL
jgi:hypothetical protein